MPPRLGSEWYPGLLNGLTDSSMSDAMAKLLIIEDDPVTRRLAVEVLTDAGHQVREAADGRRGLECFRTDPPELVITDILMPEREGLDVLLSLRRLSPRVPTIAMSVSERYLGYASKLAADAVLSKPLRPPELLATIDRLLATEAR